MTWFGDTVREDLGWASSSWLFTSAEVKLTFEWYTSVWIGLCAVVKWKGTLKWTFEWYTSVWIGLCAVVKRIFGYVICHQCIQKRIAKKIYPKQPLQKERNKNSTLREVSGDRQAGGWVPLTPWEKKEKRRVHTQKKRATQKPSTSQKSFKGRQSVTVITVAMPKVTHIPKKIHWDFTHSGDICIFTHHMGENAILNQYKKGGRKMTFSFAHGVTISLLHPLGWKQVGEKSVTFHPLWVKTGWWKQVGENRWVKMRGWK